MKSLRLLLFLTLIGSLNLFLVSCDDGDDDTPLPPAPNISFAGSSSSSAERGQDVNIQIEFNALSGVESISATVGSGSEDVAVTAGETEGTADYTYTVPENAEFDDIEIVFTILDQDGRDASTTYTITVIGSTVAVTTDISENTTWEVENVYRLDSNISVLPGVNLTIEAGTKIFASIDENQGLLQLQIESGATIDANGTVDDPIVFSSVNELTGDGAPGDWAGIKISGTPGASSGSMKYVIIKYAGEDGEDGALRLNDVESPTEIDYIQVYQSGSIGFEIRGGNFNGRHLIVTEVGDLSFSIRGGDTDFTGTLQYVIVNNNDFQDDNFFNDREVRMRSGVNAIFSNWTMIGAGKDASLNDEALDQSAIRLSNTGDTDGAIMYNFLIAEYADDGVRIDVDQDGSDVITDFISDLDGRFVLAHSYLTKIGDDATRDNTESGSMPVAWETDAGSWFNTIDKDALPAAAAGIGVDDYVPDSKIPSSADLSTVSPELETNDYVGAIGDTDWTAGWSLD